MAVFSGRSAGDASDSMPVLLFANCQRSNACHQQDRTPAIAFDGTDSPAVPSDAPISRRSVVRWVAQKSVPYRQAAVFVRGRPVRVQEPLPDWLRPMI